MEVDGPEEKSGDGIMSLSPAEQLKTILNAAGDVADANLCNGDVKPVNGNQNGNHGEAEEEMDTDDVSGSKNVGDETVKPDLKPDVEQLENNGNGEKKDNEMSDGDTDIKTNGNGDSNEAESKDAKPSIIYLNSDNNEDSKSSVDGKEHVSVKSDIEDKSKTVDADESQDAATSTVFASVEGPTADGSITPASPSGEIKKSETEKERESIERELEKELKKPMTEEEIKCAADVDQREKKLKRIEDAAKDNDDLRPVAKLLYGIGMDLGAQHIYKDLVRAQTKKQNMNRLDKRGNEQLTKLRETYKKLSNRNKAYHLTLRSCEKCGFKTESMNVIEWHLEFAHGQDEGKYECSFCDFETRLPAPFFFHMEAEHNRKGRVFMKKAFFSCPQCPYENNSKTAVVRHRLKCDKQFSLKRNQEPLPTDCDIPLKKPKSIITKRIAPTPKPPAPNLQLKSYLNSVGQATRAPVTTVVRLNNPNPTVQTILSQQHARPQLMSPSLMQSPRTRILGQGQVRPGTQQMQGAGGQMYTLVNSVMVQQLPQAAYTTILPQVRQLQPAQQQFQQQQPTQNISQIAQQVVAQVTQQHNAAQQQKAIQDILKRAQGVPNSPAVAAAAARGPAVQMTDAQAQAAAASNPKFEICEICGGFVKDRESLRIHFYWAHKVDIQKDVFARLNPHLKCDSCPQSFWTYQGLARHRQISHVKPRERSYRCYLCGAKNIENIITHLSAAHNVKLNTMYKTGKCLVCGLGFAGEKGLKRHIHTAHAELLKGQPDIVTGPVGKSLAPSPSPSSGASMLKSPGGQSKGASPVPTGLFENAAKKKKFEPVCSLCNIVFPSVESFTLHCNKLHVFKCWRCTDKWASSDLLHKHWFEKHRHDVDQCTLCTEKVTIGRPYIRHMKRSHLKECSVVLIRMPKDKVDFYQKRLETLAKGLGIVKRKSSDHEVIELSDEEDDSVAKNVTPEPPTPSKEPPAKGEPVDKSVGAVKEEKNEEETVKEEENEEEAGPSKSFLKSNEEVMEVDGEKIVITKLSDDEDENAEEAHNKDDKGDQAS